MLRKKNCPCWEQSFDFLRLIFQEKKSFMMSVLENLAGMALDALVELVSHHNKLYWEKGTPEISDADYDKLF